MFQYHSEIYYLPMGSTVSQIYLKYANYYISFASLLAKFDIESDDALDIELLTSSC